MKNVLLFLLGVASGFVLAHLVNKDPRGHELLAEVDARIGAFTDRMGDAYREQESRMMGIVDEVKDAAAEVGATARAAAADAVAGAKAAASDAVDSAKSAASDAVDATADAARKLTD
ncbi:ATPase [Microbacterium deminutum]|uniref:ATPase n=1 Tax=Microbacterium deminutum TaxID=344164 RepID=A0ABN2QER0_9MICO